LAKSTIVEIIIGQAFNAISTVNASETVGGASHAKISTEKS
jgi:hypothetical protein